MRGGYAQKVRTSNAQNGAVREFVRDRVLDLPVGLVVYGRSSLVENENLAVLDQRTRQGDERALADGQVATLIVNRAVERESIHG